MTAYLIIGFNDRAATYFKEEDCFVGEALPTEQALRQYAIDRGYDPDGLNCKPIYLYGEN